MWLIHRRDDQTLQALTRRSAGVLDRRGNLTAQLDRVNKAYITKVDRAFAGRHADSQSDQNEDFHITKTGGPLTDDNGLPYQYVDYERKANEIYPQ